MGLFSKPASSKEIRAFQRGKTSSAKAAEAHAKAAADRAGKARAAKAIKAARKK